MLNWLQAFLHPGSGATPPWMRPVGQGQGWPFYPPGYQSGGGTSLVPGQQSPMPMRTGVSPAPAATGGSPPAIPPQGGLPASQGSLGSNPYTNAMLSLLGRGGLVGAGGALLGKIMEPTPANKGEVPNYVYQNGSWVANPAAVQSGQMPMSGSDIRTNRPDPEVTGSGGQLPNVPLPTPRPQMPPSNALDLMSLNNNAGSQSPAPAPGTNIGAMIMQLLQKNGNLAPNMGIQGQ